MPLRTCHEKVGIEFVTEQAILNVSLLIGPCPGDGAPPTSGNSGAAQVAEIACVVPSGSSTVAVSVADAVPLILRVPEGVSENGWSVGPPGV